MRTVHNSGYCDFIIINEPLHLNSIGMDFGIGTALTNTHQYGNSLVMGITSPLVGERVGLQPLSMDNN